MTTNGSSNGSGTRARFDRFNVDLNTGRLQRSGLNVPIQGQPFQVLRLLLLANGEVVSREQLRFSLWPEDTFVDFEHGLNTAVRKLRQALEDSVESPKFVETLPRIGYRFIAEVEWASPNGSSFTQTASTVVSPVSTPDSKLEPPVGQWKHGAIAAHVAAIVLVAATVLFYKNSRLAQTRVGRLLHTIGRPAHPAMSERQLTANPDDTPVTSAIISPDGKYLAYTDSTGFYLRQVDNGETHPVPLPKGFEAIAESWFPDGTHLVVSRVKTPQGSPSLWEIPVMGGTARKLGEEGFSASVSPDGSTILFLKQMPSGQEVWTMQADGSHPRRLVSGPEYAFGQLAWRSDGRSFAYSKTKTRYYTSRSGPDTQIEIFDLNNNQASVVRYLGERGLPRGGAALGWTPDGRLIFPVREPRPNQQDTNLWWMQFNLATSQPEGTANRITSGRGIAVQLSLSKDGKRIAIRKHSPQPDIYIADLEGNGKSVNANRRLTLDERLDYVTAWTADSKAVIFYSNRNGPFHIFRQNIDATQPELLVGGDDDLYMPRLTPDALSIVYVIRARPGGPSNNARIMQVPLAGGPSQFVLEDSGIWDIECARHPSNLCIYSRIEAGHQTFFLFDPVKGKGAELRAAEIGGDNFDWCLSPDGKYIAWAKNRTTMEDFGIRILSLASGSTRDIAVPGWAEIYGLDWAGDSKSLWAAAHNSRGPQALLNVGLDGKVMTAQSYENGNLEWSIPSPDGRHLAIDRDNNSSNVLLLEDF